MVTRWRVAAFLGLASIAGCTIYALSDEIHQQACTFETRENMISDDCEALNDRSDPAFNRCKIWHCSDAHVCEIAPLDADRDGFSPSGCVGPTQPGDCLDDDPGVKPGAEELCDGKDNDCDSVVDEGMLQIEQRVAMTFPHAVSELGYAWDDMTRHVGVVYRDATDGSAGFGTITTTQAGVGQQVWPSDGVDVLHASAVNIAAASSGDFVLAVTEAEPARRLWVGTVIGGTLARSFLSLDEPNLRQTGLRCADDEACAALQGPRTEMLPADPALVPPPGPPPIIPESTRPEIAVLGTQGLGVQVLAGYARRLDSAADGCDVKEPAPSLLLNMLELRNTGFTEISQAAIRLDPSSELRSPRILPIDASLVRTAREPFGWLVAYLDPTGGLVVRRVRPQPDDPLADLRLRLQGDREPLLEARIARGAIEGNRYLIGVAARAGCGDRARVVFGLLQLTWDDTGRNELRIYRELREVGDEGQQASSPVLAYNRSLSVWGVAYATPDGVYARVLDRNGQPVGGSAYRLTETPPVPDMTIVAGGHDEAGQFTIYSYAEQPDQSPSHVLMARELRTCRR